MSDILFDSWLARTRALQQKSYGTDPGKLEGDERAQYFVAMSHALSVELGELAAEIGHKSWGTDRTLNRDRYLKECVDIGHFLANLIVLSGATDEEFNAAYLHKMRINEQRMAGTYSGRRTEGQAADD